MTPNETLTDGEFTLTYRFTPTEEIPTVGTRGTRHLHLQRHTICRKETTIDFEASTAIPGRFPICLIFLAFKGTMGNEVGAVIGKALTLWEIKLEEWNNGFNGNHHWAHTDINLFDRNPDNGTA